MGLRFTENKNRSSGLSVTTNPRTAFSAHGLAEATQVQAEGGTVTGKYMSPLRVFQAIAAYFNLGSGIATFLSTPSSSNLKAAVTDETGSGALVFGTSPTIATPTISTATLSGTTNLTGGQIAFPATQSASSDANTLDDYEEGTWTPAITFATPGDLSVTYSSQVGHYTKIGRMVFAEFNIVTSAFTHTTASGALSITGLPFTSGGTNRCFALSWQGITKASYTDMALQLGTGVTTMNVIGSGSGQTLATISTGDMPTGGSVIFRSAVIYDV